MQRKGLLPEGLEDQVSATDSSEEDELTDLKGLITTLEDALDEAQREISDLKNNNKILSENFPIKQSAFRFSKVFLISIPLCCLVLLVLSANEGLFLSWGTSQQQVFEFDWEIEIGAYAQAALVIAPIAFVATLLGFLLNGVFGRSSDGVEKSLSQAVAQIANGAEK